MAQAEVEALLQLPTVQPFLQQITTLLSSSHPPQSVLIHAPTNSCLVLPLLLHIFHHLPSAPTTHSATAPTIQQLLPNYATLDLVQLHSPRAAFDTILNHLSAWHHPGELPWDPIRGGVSNWDGRVQGITVQQRKGKGKGKGKRKATEGQTARKRSKKDDSTTIPDSEAEEQRDDEQDSDDYDDADSLNAEPPHWSLIWDRTLPSPSHVGELTPLRDTLESFHHSLSKIASLGSPSAPSPSSASSTSTFAQRLFTPDEQSERPKHRFIVFTNGQLLPDLAAPGNVGGAPRETGQGMTFESTIRRLGELSRLPLTSITISSLSIPKSRGDMVGLLDPTLVQFPDLGATVDSPTSPSTVPDPVLLLTSRFALTLPPNPLPPPSSLSPSSNNPNPNPYLPLSRTDLIQLFQSLANLIWDLFSKYLVEVEDLAGLCARYWGKWRAVVEGSNPPIAPTNTSALASHLKSDFTYERSLLGLSHPATSSSSASPSTEPTPTQLAPQPPLHGFAGSMPALPPRPTFLANPGEPGTSTQGDVFSPLASTSTTTTPSSLPPTPLKKHALPSPSSHSTTLATRSSQTLSKSLPRLARFLLIAAHFASFNSPKNDVRCFVKVDENVAKRGKKGRKGARKQQGTSPLKAKLTTELSGAKPFPLERLLAIFEAIVADRIEYESMARSWDVGSLIASLLSLRLLQRVSSQANSEKLLNGVKMRSTLGREAVDVLARSVGFGEWGEMLGDGE